MRGYVFIIREYDAQASFVKYRKVRVFGVDVQQAFARAQRIYCKYVEDYDFSVLTLNEFNKQRK